MEAEFLLYSSKSIYTNIYSQITWIFRVDFGDHGKFGKTEYTEIIEKIPHVPNFRMLRVLKNTCVDTFAV